MLKQLLDCAAHAYGNCDNPGAGFVAHCLRRLTVPEDLSLEPRPPSRKGIKAAFSAPDCYQPIRPFEALMKQLPWVKSGENRAIPADFSGTYYFTMIVGPQAPVFSNDIRFGLFLQEPRTQYPSHKHAAEEFYYPLSGTALWQKDQREFVAIAPANLIHHTSYQPHATTTGDHPLLAFWAWTGNLTVETYSFVTEP